MAWLSTSQRVQRRSHQRASLFQKHEKAKEKELVEGSAVFEVFDGFQTENQVFVEDIIIFSKWFQTTMNTIVIFVLFGDSIRNLIIDSNIWEIVDVCFFVGFIFAFLLFCIEIIAQCYSIPRYFSWSKRIGKDKKIMTRLQQLKAGYFPKGSFYFWLDLIATLSLSFEIMSFLSAEWDVLAPPSATNFELGFINITQSNLEKKDIVSSYPAAEKFGFMGSDSLYLVLRVSRMIRLFRIVKMFKSYENYFFVNGGAKPLTKVSKTDHTTDEGNNLTYEDGDGVHSFIGTSMSETTMKRATVGVLLILMVLPALDRPVHSTSCLLSSQFSHVFFCKSRLCQNELYDSQLNKDQSMTKAICENINDGFEMAKLKVTENHCEEKLIKLKYIAIFENKTVSCNTSETCDKFEKYVIEDGPAQPMTHIARNYQYRKNSVGTLVFKSFNQDLTFKSISIWDKSNLNADEAMGNIILTGFIITLLTVATIVFSIDTKRIVLNPIDRLMSRVIKICENPLESSADDSSLQKHPSSADLVETDLLLETIEKISNLMRMGFGEAGLGSLQNLKEMGSTIDFDIEKASKNMLKGSPVVAIFGFCDIRNFTDVTEVLGEEVMKFVNRVAYILHAVVKDCGGSANKNIGDAFLVTWKVPQEACKTSNSALTGEIHPSEKTRDLFDQALYAFLRFTVLLREHSSFIEAFSAPTLNKIKIRMGDYKCALGMGLHIGLAYEGGIGTSHKLDATYISEHVNHVEFLESSTKKFKVSVLMSHFFKDNLSIKVQSLCRYIDSEEVSSASSTSSEADHGLTFHLWTYDIFQPFQKYQQAQRAYDGAHRHHYSSLGGGSRHRRHNNEGNAKNNPKIAQRMGIKVGDDRTPILDTIIPKIGEEISIEDGEHFCNVTVTSENFIKYVWSQDEKVQALRECVQHQGMMESWEICVRLLQEQEWSECLHRLELFQENHNTSNGGCDDGPAEYLIDKVKEKVCEFQHANKQLD